MQFVIYEKDKPVLSKSNDLYTLMKYITKKTGSFPTQLAVLRYYNNCYTLADCDIYRYSGVENDEVVYQKWDGRKYKYFYVHKYTQTSIFRVKAFYDKNGELLYKMEDFIDDSRLES